MSVPELMAAVQLVGHGGDDKLVYTESAPVPKVGRGRGAHEGAGGWH